MIMSELESENRKLSPSRIVSGTRATGGLHLGNYIGALKQWKSFVDREQSAEFLFFIADLHAITTSYDKDKLADNTREIAAAYIASGIDINKVTLFAHSAVPEHTYMQWLFTSITPLGWLNRMTQFKEKAGKKRENASLGLYAYPVLQAADVLLYQASHVPVGEDQKQHIELAREIAGAFNHRYGADFFNLPEPVILEEGARIMSLRNGREKMSKSSESDMSRINLTDTADEISKKIRKAKTDPSPLPELFEELADRPEAANLITIYASLSDKNRQDVLSEFAGKQFSEFKPALADLAIERLSPVTKEMNRLMKSPDDLDSILVSGARRAREIAQPVLNQARELMGFWKG